MAVRDRIRILHIAARDPFVCKGRAQRSRYFIGFTPLLLDLILLYPTNENYAR